MYFVVSISHGVQVVLDVHQVTVPAAIKTLLFLINAIHTTLAVVQEMNAKSHGRPSPRI